MTSIRKVLRLDGKWQIAEGGMEECPPTFDRVVPVPGLVDLATPAFEQVGLNSPRREAFWYRRTFRVTGEMPPVALLKVYKATYGTRVMVNGHFAGEHLPCFTPGWFDVRPHLKRGPNEIVIRVGAWRESVPRSVADGFDFEKIRYSPGIYDSVELHLTGTQHVVRVQTVPDIEAQTVRVVALLRNAGSEAGTGAVRFTVRESRSRCVAGIAELPDVDFAPDAEQEVVVSIPIHDCRLWSPEDPFLYDLEVSTVGDSFETRFGMRSFRFDRETGFGVLNGKRYPLRGSNTCLFRFFEDSECGNKPWDAKWVRRLHRRVKEMNWNSMRYCIGFPPEAWYRIADEEGILIQDEFPIWYVNRWPEELKSDQLVREFTEWMQERWNHACVVIWDAQNETEGEVTGEAIRAVRNLDLSNRPWDNGWGHYREETDVFEAHPYAGIGGTLDMVDFAKRPPRPGLEGSLTNNTAPYGGGPVIINEYAWLWLNRNGTPTKGTQAVYASLLGANPTIDQLRTTRARLFAAKTEFWRSHQQVAGIQHFCLLGFSRPGMGTAPDAVHPELMHGSQGEIIGLISRKDPQTAAPNLLSDAYGNTEGMTSDDLVNVEKVLIEPIFQRFVRDAFDPVGVMIDWWGDLQFAPRDANRPVPVAVINDLPDEVRGELLLRISPNTQVVPPRRAGKIVARVPLHVTPHGRTLLQIPWTAPANQGEYHLVAEARLSGRRAVQSWRDLTVTKI